MIDAAELNERLEETKRGLLETYPWATIQDSRIIWDNYAPVMQVELTHPDLKCRLTGIVDVPVSLRFAETIMRLGWPLQRGSLWGWFEEVLNA
jgi:hypothetical protein